VVRCFDGTQLENHVKIVAIEDETHDAVETVETIVKKANIRGPIFIKDVDNFYRSQVPMARN